MTFAGRYADKGAGTLTGEHQKILLVGLIRLMLPFQIMDQDCMGN